MKLEDSHAREFWLRVNGLLTKHGMTKQDLARATGINYGTLTNKSSGATYVFPNVEASHAIADALGTTVEYLMTGEEPPPRHTSYDDIIARLDIATPEECDMVRRMLGLPVHERKSIEA